MAIGQAQKGLEFICAVSGAGFYIRSYSSKVFRMLDVLKLSGYLFFTFRKSERSFAKVISRRQGEIIKPVSIVFAVFLKPEKQCVLIFAVVGTAVFEVFLIAGMKETVISALESTEFISGETARSGRDKLLAPMDHAGEEFLHASSPLVTGSVVDFLKVPFQVLKAFYVPEGKAFMITDDVMIVHYNGRFIKLWEDVVAENPVHVLPEVSAVESNTFVAVKPEGLFTGCKV